MILLRVIVETCRTPRYVIAGIFVAFLLFASVVVLSQYDMILSIVGAVGMSIFERLWLASTMAVYGFSAMQTVVSWTLYTIVFVLTIVYGAVSMRDIHERIRVRATGRFGLIGSLVAIFGIGCSACGSALLSSIFGFSVATALVVSLPFGGHELLAGGCALLIISIAVSARALAQPRTCAL